LKRREVIGFLAGAATAWPVTARAKQPARPVIGFLSSASPQLYANRLGAFHRELKEAGYVEGQWPEIAKRAMLGAAQSRRDLVSAGASGKHMNKRIGPPMPPVLHAGSRRNSANIQKAAVPGFEPKKNVNLC
jgi:hypothetical protein